MKRRNGLMAGSVMLLAMMVLLTGCGISSKSETPVATNQDTTPPTAPGSPVVTVISATQADLAWTASTDNVGVSEYQVYRGATKAGAVKTTTFSDTGYTAGACYTVKAVDAAGNVSSESSQVCGTITPASGAAPTIWKTTLTNVSVYHDTSGAGVNTYLTLVLTQSGDTLSGTVGFQDNLGRSGSANVTGSLSGNAITMQYTDMDPACASRTKTWTGTKSSTSMLASMTAPVAGTCQASNTASYTFILATPVTYTASGTYSFPSSPGTLTLNTTATTFTNDGPKMGIDAITGVTVNATTQTWVGNDNMTWTRAGGTAGDINGTWTASSSFGDTYAFTFNADNTFSLTGYMVSARGKADVYTQTFSNSTSNSYMARPVYDDPSHAATSVVVTGPGITGSLALAYDSGRGEWASWSLPGNPVSFGATHPALPLTYTFSVTTASGTTTETATAMCFMEFFATPVSTPKYGGSQSFTWTKVPYQNMRYDIEMHNPNGGNNIWNTYDNNNNPVDASSVVYSGPVLTPGTTYQYNLNVRADNSSGGFDCSSFKQASFVY